MSKLAVFFIWLNVTLILPSLSGCTASTPTALAPAPKESGVVAPPVQQLPSFSVPKDVGTPTLVERSSQDPPKLSVAEAAKLTTQQVAELKSTVGSGKDFKTQEVVILPTDVPQGYKITHFVAWKQQSPSPRFYGGHYSIVYQNDRGACFTISGGITQPIGDAPTRYEEIVGLSSPALGSMAMGVTEGDYASNRRSFIGFTESMNRVFRGRNEYSFQSPTLDIDKDYRAVITILWTVFRTAL